MGKKFGKLSIRENLVVTSVYSFRSYLFGGYGRESGVSTLGGGVSCDVFVQPAFFLAGNRPRNGVAKSSRSKHCLL